MDDDEQCYSATIEQLVEMLCSVYQPLYGTVGREQIISEFELDVNEKGLFLVVVKKGRIDIGGRYYGWHPAEKLIPYIQANFDVDEGDEIVLK
jgi:hypothetical protein